MAFGIVVIVTLAFVGLIVAIIHAERSNPARRLNPNTKGADGREVHWVDVPGSAGGDGAGDSGGGGDGGGDGGGGGGGD
jgi:hypothetical protein